MENVLAEAKAILRDMTGKSSIALLDRGNSAIRLGLEIAHSLGRLKALIPDQGGWYSYRKLPARQGMQAVEIRTDLGIVSAESLKEALDKGSVLLYANPAGYFANQDIREIYESSRDGLVIMDVSGSIGDPKLCDGRYADILVGSFGKWKAAPAGCGGFLATGLQEAAPFLKDSIDESCIPKVVDALHDAGERLKRLYSLAAEVKRDLAGFGIIHKERKGINVVVASTDAKVADYCQKRGYEYVLCPNYIKVMAEATSIELKRLSFRS